MKSLKALTLALTGLLWGCQAAIILLDSIFPACASSAGGVTVRLSGFGFTASTTITISGTSIPRRLVSATEMLLEIPALAAGYAELIANDTEGFANALYIWIYPTPTVAGATPRRIKVTGGEMIDIHGVGFAGPGQDRSSIRVRFEESGRPEATTVVLGALDVSRGEEIIRVTAPPWHWSSAVALVNVSVALDGTTFVGGPQIDVVPTTPVKVGFIYSSSIDDFGWTYQQNLGRLQVQAKFAGVVDLSFYKEGVPEGEFVSPKDETNPLWQSGITLMRKWCQESLDLVFGASFGYLSQLEFMSKLPECRENPSGKSTFFSHVSGWTHNDYLSNTFSRIYQMRYYSGLIAGSVLGSTLRNTTCVGYLAAYPIPEVERGINAFARGCQEANPACIIKVLWTGTWHNRWVEGQAAHFVWDTLQCDMLAQHSDTTEPQIVMKNYGGVSIGYHADHRTLVGDSVLTSAMIQWGAVWKQQVEQIVRGKWNGLEISTPPWVDSNTEWGESVWLGHAEGASALAPFSNQVPTTAQRFVLQGLADLKAGAVPVTTPAFCGPLTVAYSHVFISKYTHAAKYLDGVTVTRHTDGNITTIALTLAVMTAADMAAAALTPGQLVTVRYDTSPNPTAAYAVVQEVEDKVITVSGDFQGSATTYSPSTGPFLYTVRVDRFGVQVNEGFNAIWEKKDPSNSTVFGFHEDPQKCSGMYDSARVYNNPRTGKAECCLSDFPGLLAHDFIVGNVEFSSGQDGFYGQVAGADYKKLTERHSWTACGNPFCGNGDGFFTPRFNPSDPPCPRSVYQVWATPESGHIQVVVEVNGGIVERYRYQDGCVAKERFQFAAHVFVRTSLVNLTTALGIIGMMTCVVLAVCVFAKREHLIIRRSQPTFLYIMIVGCLISTSSLFVFVVDDRATLDLNGLIANAKEIAGGGSKTTGASTTANRTAWTNADIACMAQAWLYWVGFAVSYSALLLKTWRIQALLKISTSGTTNTKSLSSQVSIKKLLRWVVLIVLAVGIPLTCWTAISPLRFGRRNVAFTPDLRHVTDSRGSCEGPEGTWSWVAILCVLQAFCYLYGNVILYRARFVSTVFSERKYITIAMVSNIQVLFVSLPLLVLVSDNPEALLLIKAGCVFLNDITMVLVILAPKIYGAVTIPEDEARRRFIDGARQMVEAMAGRTASRKGSRKKNALTSGSMSRVVPSTAGEELGG